MRRFCIVCGLVLVGIGAVVFLVLKTPAADQLLARLVSSAARRSGAELSFGRFDFDPWGPSVRLDQVRFVTADGLSFEAVHLVARLRPLASLSGALTFDLDATRPRLVGRLDGFGGGTGGFPPLSVENCAVVDGSVDLTLLDGQLGVVLEGVGVDWRNRKGTAGIVGGRVSWRGAEEALKGVSFAGEQRFGAVEVEKIEVSTDRFQMQSHGRIGPWGALGLETDLFVAADPLPEGWVRALGLGKHRPVGGRVELSSQLRGTFSHPLVTGVLKATDLRFGGVEPASVRVVLAADLEGLRFEDLTLDGPVVAVRGVSGTLGWADGLTLVADGRCDRFDLRPFMGLLVDGWFPVGVRAGGTFHAEGPLAPLSLSCRADLDASDLDVTLEEGAEPVYVLDAAHVTSNLQVGAEEIRFGATSVTTGATRVEIPSGRIDYDLGLWFDTEVRTEDLAPFGGYVPVGWKVSGKASGRFGGPYRELTFHYDLDFPHVGYAVADLGAVTGHADYDLTTLEVTDTRLDGPGGALELDGGVDLVSGGSWNMEVTTEGIDLESAAVQVRALGVEGIPRLGGVAAVRGRVEGPLGAPVFDGVFAVPGLTLAGHRVDGLKGRGLFSLEDWNVSKLVGTVRGGSFEAEGKGDREGFEVSVGIHRWEPARVADEWGVSVPLEGFVEGRLEAQGDYLDPTARFVGTWMDAGWNGWSPGNVQVDFGFEGGQVSGRFSAADGALSAEATVATGAPGTYRVVTEARGFDLSVFAGRVSAGVEPGRLTGGVTVEGDWSSPGAFRVLGEATLAGAGAPGRPFSPVKIFLDGRKKGLELKADADAGAVRLFSLWSWQPGTPVAFDLGFDDARLERVGLFGVTGGSFDGRISGVVGIDGLLAGPDVGERLDAVTDLSGDLRWSGLVVDDQWRIPDGTFHLERQGGPVHGRVRLPGLDLDVGGIPLDRSWTVSGTLDGFEPAPWFSPGHPGSGVEGRWAGRFGGSGVGRNVTQGVVQAQVEALAWGPLAPSAWSVDGTWAEGLLHGRVARPDGLSVDLEWARARGWSLVGTMDRARPEEWVRGGFFSPDVRTEWTGRVEARLPPGLDPDIDVRFSRVWASLPPVELENRGDVRVRYTDGRVFADAVSFVGEGLALEIEGTVGPRKGWDLGLTGTCNLQVLPRWFDEVSRASGKVKGDLRVLGPWNVPYLEGPVELKSGARVALGSLTVPFEDADASLRFERGKAALEWFDAQFGDGRVHLEGMADLGEDGKPGELRLFAELRDIAYEAPPQVSYTADADFLVGGTVAAPQIRGDVRLERFRFSRRLTLTNLIVAALSRQAEVVSTGMGDEGGVYVDVAVRGDRDLRIENNLASLPLTVDLRARGYLPEPELWGRVGIQEGKARFRSLDYEIARSSVEFLGETSLVPLIDFHARTETSGYRINVEATGPLDDYQVALSSAPPLSQTDIVALLTLGSTTDEIASGEGLGQAEAASLITGGLVESVGGELSTVFGIDQFQIDPVYSPTTQSTVPKVTLGRPLTRNLYTRYSVAVGTEYEQDLEVQYSWTRNLSFLGTWSDKGTSQEGSLGGEIRFRFGFR